MKNFHDCCEFQGFWEMIYFQVEDVNLKFVELGDLEAKNWITEEKPKTKAPTAVKKIVSKPFKPKVKASSNLRAMLAEKRKAVTKTNKENDNPQIIVTKDDNDVPIEKKVIFFSLLHLLSMLNLKTF